MEIFRSLNDIKVNRETSIAVGNFDGLHLGHMQVLDMALNGAENLASYVMTFSRNTHDTSMIMTSSDKEKLLEEKGFDYLSVLDFDEIKSKEAAEFFNEVLLKKCKIKRLCCGDDFRFGKGAKGDITMLKELCSKAEVELVVVPDLSDEHGVISSSRIRECLREGNVKVANEMLGRPFGFKLEVIHGNHIGMGLGMPTINQALPSGFILPKFGVYASFAIIDGIRYWGVTNIGVKPTVGSDRVLSETWMPDFSGDLYGKLIRLEIIDFIRPEVKFDSLEEMKEQVNLDKEEARRRLTI